MKRRTGQKALLFFIEKYDGLDNWVKESTRPLKHALTYMNKFTIDEDDQYDISSIKILKSNRGTKTVKRLTKIERMMQSMSTFPANHIDIFYFGWYDSREHLGHSKPDINGILQKCFGKINSNIDNVRISFMDMNRRYLRDCAVPIRTDFQGVKNLYNKKRTYTVSLNDQMDLFYEKCRDDELTQHEVAYYFHAQLLPPDKCALYYEEFEPKETLKHNNEIASKSNFGQNERDKLEEKHRKIKKESIESEFDLLAGVRATLVFHPEPHLQRTRQFHSIANILSQMMYAQFWPESCTTDIPETTTDIKIIGAENFKLQNIIKKSIRFKSYYANRIPQNNENMAPSLPRALLERENIKAEQKEISEAKKRFKPYYANRIPQNNENMPSLPRALLEWLAEKKEISEAKKKFLTALCSCNM